MASPADEEEVALSTFLSVRLAYGRPMAEEEPQLLRAMPLGLALQACQVVGGLSAAPPLDARRSRRAAAPTAR